MPLKSGNNPKLHPNGQMSGTDPYKDLTIQYNFLNLPKQITKGGSNITIRYDATGRKWSQAGPEGIREYVGGIEYLDQEIQSVQHGEGRLVPTYSGTSIESIRAEFWRQDHLGNTRIAFSDFNLDGVIATKDDPNTTENEVEITQENHYYPFGLNHEGPWYETIQPRNKHQYSGKEYIEDLGLNWNDYGARWYDPAAGRWNNIDPLVDKYVSYSPYSYVLGNPISITDPNGMSVDTEIYDYTGKKVGEDENGRDGNIAIVNNDVSKQLKKGEITASDAISQSNLHTTIDVLEESLDVLTRTYKNGGLNEEISVVTPEGEAIRGETGPSLIEGGTKTANMPKVEGTDNTLIHSHIVGFEVVQGKRYGSDALNPTDVDYVTFKGFKQNVIVGKLGEPKVQDGEPVPRSDGAVFFGRNGEIQGTLLEKAIKRIIKN